MKQFDLVEAFHLLKIHFQNCDSIQYMYSVPKLCTTAKCKPSVSYHIFQYI